MRKFVVGYLAVMLVIATFAVFFGEQKGRSFFYNLGRSVIWPVTLVTSTVNTVGKVFKSATKLDGRTPQGFAVTHLQVMKDLREDREEQWSYSQGFTDISILYFVKNTPNFSASKYQEMLNKDQAPDSLMRSLINDRALQDKIYLFMDGMKYKDVIAAGIKAKAETLEIFAQRTAAQNKANAESTDTYVLKEDPRPGAEGFGIILVTDKGNFVIPTSNRTLPPELAIFGDAKVGTCLRIRSSRDGDDGSFKEMKLKSVVACS